MNNLKKTWKNSLLLGSASAALAVGMLASVQAAFADDTPIETVVVTGTRFNTDAAPAKASLETTEPQTIINKSYIDNFVMPQADYVTILGIVPSMTGGDINGVGLSDGGTKNTLRGLPDGNFVMQYDDIPFGDTNGPTHHNISYFPASTIGSAVVDRGPGNAGNLGASTYGGTIKLFSDTLSDEMHGYADAGYGSFDTWFANVNGQSGAVDLLGTKAKVLVNLQDMGSEGALSGQNLRTQNALLKIEDQFATHWSFTLFGDYSYLKENLDDNNGLTPAQVHYYGKNFALQDTNPLLPTYGPYNYTTKQTDMEYFKVNGDITSTLKVSNQAYTYAYWNHTISPNNQEQTDGSNPGDTFDTPSTSGDPNNLLNVANGVCANPAKADQCFQGEGTTIPSGPNKGSYATDILAYDKQNAYRVWGDVFRISQDFNFDELAGQIRAGIWWESQTTHRFKYYFDINVCQANGIDPFVQGFVEAATICGAKKGSAPVPGLGYSKDDEHSSWDQYEPFVEIDIKPTDNLTITPGLKYIHWVHDVNAPVEQGSACGIDNWCYTTPVPATKPYPDYVASFTTNATLPFMTVNYKIDPSWSTYFEYAQGIYVPDIGTFEQGTATGTFPAAERTTNYQLGTVYYADNFTFDGDYYYIPIKNNYVTQQCSYDMNETCFVNNGGANYRGVEGEGTYAFDELFGFDVHGLSVFLNGANMSSRDEHHHWEPNAPFYTYAAGVQYMANGWKFALVDKTVGPQYSDSNNYKYYELGEYSDVNATIGYQYEMVQMSVFVDNILDTRPTTLITEAGGLQNNPATSQDQYFFQAPRSVMFNVKVSY